ncbi:MAG: hypothetical protein GPOALKHO_001663 [Sodalis sp.]|nr:MAG: hypothetical protein GPOALKHO_001663 [Sodalis sp.]
MHLGDSQTPVSDSLLERYLRIIDLSNDGQLMQDENGHWQVTGGPTEGVLKVPATKMTLPLVASALRR